MQVRWACLAHLKFLQFQSLNRILLIVRGMMKGVTNEDTDVGSFVYTTKKYHRCDNKIVAEEIIEKQLPLYVTMHASGRFVVHMTPPRMSKTHVALEVLALHHVESHLDVDHFQWQFSDEPSRFAPEEDPITMHFLFLPRSIEQKVHAVINEDWQEMRYNPVTQDCDMEDV
jgi:hypothetical protein